MKARYDEPSVNPEQKELSPTEEKCGQPLQAKEKSGAFRRYDTYIVCPACGSMVSKGTKRCACGFDLQSPIEKFFESIKKHALSLVLFAVIVVLSILLFSTSSDLQAANNKIDELAQKEQRLEERIDDLIAARDEVTSLYYEVKNKCGDCIICNGPKLPSLDLPNIPLF